jgi:hypothetical protein
MSSGHIKNVSGAGSKDRDEIASITLDHTSTSVTLKFKSNLNGTGEDESFGLSDIEISYKSGDEDVEETNEFDDDGKLILAKDDENI